MTWNGLRMSRNMEELAPLVSTTQLLASYLRPKRYPGTLYTRSVAVKMDDYRKRRKLSHVCHESSAGIELGGRLVRNNLAIAGLKR